MKLDAIVFVDSRNKTLLTREPLALTSDIQASVVALGNQTKEPVFALRSYCDNEGVEVRVELYTPQALAQAPDKTLTLVEVWHARRMAFSDSHEAGAILDKSAYELTAILLVGPSDESVDDALNNAYRYSQNLNHSWNPTKSSRSSSVGDIFVVATGPKKQDAYAVAGCGFTPVNLA